MYSPPVTQLFRPAIPPPLRRRFEEKDTAPLTQSDSPFAWTGWLFQGLDRLGERPFTLLLVVMALNALVLPYLGLDHDSRLYAVQAIEHVRPGYFGDDLYLRYGSQDRYSVFSFLVTPLVAVMGAATTFFLLYLICKFFFFFAVLRLLRRLVRDRGAAALGILYLAVVAAPLGGNEVFNLNESFLTPRLPSMALAILAMERLLAGRAGQSLLLLVGSFLLHPMMALGGFLTWILFVLSRRLSWKGLLAVGFTAALAGAVTIVWEPLGQRLYGHVDDEWLDIIFRTCFFIRPSLWTASDWLRITWAVVVVIAACVGFARMSARLLLAVLATGMIGLAGTIIAVQCHYLLLIQASPYRALWLLELLAIPLGVAWACAVSRRGTRAGHAVGLAMLLVAMAEWGTTPFIAVGFFVLAFPFLAALHRGFQSVPRREDWLLATTHSSFVFSFLILCIIDVLLIGVISFVTPDPAKELDIHLLPILRNFPRLLHKLPLVVLGFVLIRRLMESGRRRLGIVALSVWLGYQGVVIGMDVSSWYGQTFSVTGRQIALIKQHIASREPGKIPTVYWPRDPRHLWFDVGTRIYFNTAQLSGCAFNRGTAIEGYRRSRLVRRFEGFLIRRSPPPEPWWRDALDKFFDLAPDEPAPTREDLLRLCQDPALDVAVVDTKFDGLYAATDGKIYIYDCAQIRKEVPADRPPSPPGRSEKDHD